MATEADSSSGSAGQPVALDDVDLRLLAQLQVEGRLSMRALAERVHISRAGCYARVERLQREGVITGYAAIVNPRKLGRTVSAHIHVKIRQHSWKKRPASTATGAGGRTRGAGVRRQRPGLVCPYS
ncbi:Lrp/AsnC family transcriptional regulator [Fodinicola feengrottensis]|uniref:Lrp/AsnC family transcriptional regulator n=1 Tax=Fodinicola feengrottensis TaxID=435914 RepID=UPI002441A02B|nr:winged helix-turn-helix transcriptional regulator [Fodinicola feengrottensis]